MPILSIDDKRTIEQQCAECNATNSIASSGLQLGVVSDTASDPNLIALPPCACGAQEFLNRTFDVAPDNLAAHRKKVNALAIDLKARGQIHPGLKTKIHAEKHAPTQIGDLVGAVAAPAQSLTPDVNPALAMLKTLAGMVRQKDPKLAAARAARLAKKT